VARKTIPISELTEKDKARFWSKVEVQAKGRCREWLGCKNKGGYGVFRLNGKVYLAHRIAYVLANGSIPDGMLICHKCDNRGCEEAEHFFVGEYKDNIQDMLKKGRGSWVAGGNHWSITNPEKLARGDRHGSKTHPESRPRGEKHGNRELTEFKVLEARRRYSEGETQTSIAKDFGISYQQVSRIVNRKQWTHV